MLLLAALGAACGGGAARYETRLAPPTLTREPPGVVVQRSFAPPGPGDRDDRLLVLEPPVDLAEARQLIEAFFSSIRAQDTAALEHLFGAGALQQLASGREVRGAREYWQRRLARLDYGALPEGPLVRLEEAELRRFGEPPALGRSDGDRGAPRSSTEVSLTVQLLATHAGSTRVFGPELTFVLTEEDGRLVIARILEDFQLL